MNKSLQFVKCKFNQKSRITQAKVTNEIKDLRAPINEMKYNLKDLDFLSQIQLFTLSSKTRRKEPNKRQKPGESTKKCSKLFDPRQPFLLEANFFNIICIVFLFGQQKENFFHRV